MPVVKPPTTPTTPTQPVAAMTEQSRVRQTRPFQTGSAPTFDAQANLVRTPTGIADPGKAPKQKALLTGAPEFKGNGELKKPINPQQMARQNAKITTQNAQNVQKAQGQAVRDARRTRMADTDGVSAGPSVFGPSLGTAGSRVDNPPDFPFFKVT